MSKWSSAYRDSRWQQKRLAIMERDKWTCRSCGKAGEGVTLNVHHAYYESGKAPWEYDDDVLITWCEDCHKYRHMRNKDLSIALAETTLDDFDGIFSLITDSELILHAVAFARMNCGGEEIEPMVAVLKAITELVKCKETEAEEITEWRLRKDESK